MNREAFTEQYGRITSLTVGVFVYTLYQMVKSEAISMDCAMSIMDTSGRLMQTRVAALKDAVEPGVPMSEKAAIIMQSLHDDIDPIDEIARPMFMGGIIPGLDDQSETIVPDPERVQAEGAMDAASAFTTT